MVSEAQKIASKKWYELHRSEVIERGKRYYAAHREAGKATRKIYRDKEAKKIAIANKEYRELHHDELIERGKKDYADRRETRKAKAKIYRDTHKTEVKILSKKYREKYSGKLRMVLLDLKHAILTHYGDGKLACVLCGYINPDALTIDHIDGNGASHRKSINGGNIYLWIKKNNYPRGFRTLCMNCQWVEYVKQRRINGKQ